MSKYKMIRQIIVGARTIAMPNEIVTGEMLRIRLESVIIERQFAVEITNQRKPKTAPENKAEKPVADKSMGGRLSKWGDKPEKKLGV